MAQTPDDTLRKVGVMDQDVNFPSNTKALKSDKQPTPDLATQDSNPVSSKTSTDQAEPKAIRYVSFELDIPPSEPEIPIKSQDYTEQEALARFADDFPEISGRENEVDSYQQSPTPIHEINSRNTLTLEARDQAALEYSKNRLIEGDTLVITSKNRDAAIYSHLGFALDSEYRVHSTKLLNTGSSYFQKMLQPIEQGRLRRSAVFRSKPLPNGVEFVLDLSPDNENGEILLHELSCPEGIRCWFRAKSRNDIDSFLLMGEEETETLQKESRLSISHDDLNKTSGVSSLFRELATKPATVVVDGNKDPSHKDSRKVDSTQNSLKAQFDQLEAANNNIPLDYTQVRHRACIERLLQIIEGKHARLDSATKVWTVSMLAGMYGCESAVVDEVTSWIYASNNSCIIEILPEAIFKLGITLKSYMLTRAAFNVLVSEEAFCMRPDTAPSQRSSITPLGRRRDDFTLGEDHLDMIQKAALSFNEQIMEVIDMLISPQVSWLQGCSEFQKLEDFRSRVLEDPEYKSSKPGEAALSLIDKLEDHLRHYYRGRIISVQTQSLTSVQIDFANKRRLHEHWSSEPRLPFDEYYNMLTLSQRSCVRQFWNELGLFRHKSANGFNIWANYGDDIPKDLVKLSENTLHTLARELNLEIFNFATRDVPLTSPYLQAESLKLFAERWPTTNRLQELTGQYHAAVCDSRTPSTAQFIAYELSTFHTTNILHPKSIFFNFDTLCKEAARYIRGVSSKMLSRSEDSQGLTIAEGLTCITEHQYKFLPLFAGGCDDGSGGVGSDIPLPSVDNWDEINSHAGVFVGTNTATAGASTYRGHDVESSVNFGSHAFKDLGLQSPKQGRKDMVAPPRSETDSFSDLGHDGTMSEISFASTFDGEHISGNSTRAVVESSAHPRNEALEAIMSDDFMLEDSGDLDDDFGSDDFDDLDDGDETETED